MAPPALGSAATPVAISVLIELANLAAVTTSSSITSVLILVNAIISYPIM